MARITWQSVGAPDLGSAVQSQELAAKLLSSATNSFGDAFSGISDIQNQKASAAAMQRALAIQDPAEWDRMMAAGGIGALGVSADRATPELLDLVQGRGSVLDAQQKSTYEFERQRMEAGRADQERQIREQGKALADKIGYSSFSPEEAKAEIIKATEGNPMLREAAFGALGGVSDAAWTALPQTKFDANTNMVLTGIGRTLSQRENEINIAYGGNEALRLLDQGVKAYGSDGNPLPALIDNMTSALQKKGLKEEEDAVFSETAGSITKVYNDLSREFPDIPREMVAAAMGQFLEDDGWIMTGDQVDIARNKASELLKQVATKENRQGLYDQQAALTEQRGSIAATRDRVNYLQGRLQLALSRGGPAAEEEASKITLELNSILAGMGANAAASAAADREFPLGKEAPSAKQADPGLDRGLNELDQQAKRTGRYGNVSLSENLNFSGEDRVGAYTDRQTNVAEVVPEPSPSYVNPRYARRVPSAGAEDIPPPAVEPEVDTRFAGVMNNASRNPRNTAMAILQASSVPADLVQTASAIITQLETKTGSNDSRKALERQLEEILKMAEKDVGEDEAISALLRNKEKWLRFSN